MATTAPKEISPVALLLLAGLLYIFFTEPSEKALLVAIAAIAAWVTLKSCNAGFAVIAAFYLLKLYNAATEVAPPPAALEKPKALPPGGAYPKDPASVQARIEAVKGGAPLKPKIETVTGVLESPTILDAAPLQPLDKLASEALPGATIPASAKARVAIYAPPEDTVSKEATVEKAPVANPFLQTGPDAEGTMIALIPKGTDFPSIDNIGSQIEGALAGAGLAF